MSRHVQDGAAGRSFEDALNILAHQIRLAIGAHQSAISYIPHGDFQDAVHAASLSEKYEKYLNYDVMPKGRGIWTVVIEQKRPVRMTAAEVLAHPQWANFSNARDARGLEHPPMRGWLAAPILRANQDVLGILQLTDKFDDADFTDADLDLLVHLASMALPTFELHFVNEQLHALTHDLERRVRERTEALERANAELREREQRLRDLFNHSPDAIIIQSLDARVLDVNPAACELHGLECSQLVGKHVSELVPPQFTDEVMESFGRLVRGEIRHLESFTVTPSGGSVPVEVRASRVQWLGQPAVLLHVRDVTDRKQAEDAREHHRRLLQGVLDHIPQGVFWKDRNSVYLGCNQVLARAYELGHPDRIIGLTDFDLPGLRREQAEMFVRMDREVMKTNTPKFHILETATLPDGRTVWLETTKIPLRDAEGHVVGILGTWQDITERKKTEEERARLEAQLQHTQKLESLGVLAGGIAHDFNNLLTSVLGYADLAMRELVPGSVAHEHITSAADGARRAAELTSQMLAYSGKGHFVVEPLDISSVVEDLTRLLQISISKKCVVKYNLAKNLPLVDADSAQFRQIVMNLIINASEAIGDRSGVISVTTGVMQCDRAYLAETYLNDSLTPGVYVYLEVADTGCGMTDEVRARIFDPFFTTKFTGRGLGLSAVLGIVRGHRGAIKCYSEVDRGTTFKVLLPAAAAAPPTAPSAKGPDATWRGSGVVLVVDDEDTVRVLVQRMLEAMGFTVLTARDGADGVAVFREEHPRIRFVLLDMTMPRLDGEETFREMRRIRGDVLAILTSGYNEQTATSRFAGKGLAAFIQKPYSYAELMAVVQKVLGERSETTGGAT